MYLCTPKAICIDAKDVWATLPRKGYIIVQNADAQSC